MARASVIPALDAPRSPAAEAYRVIRTKLQIASQEERVKSIVVISSMLGEGKSTTAINLAVSYAQAGNNVLIVDADMRKPSIHNIMGLNNQVGLTNLIIGEETLDKVVQTSRVPNLHVVTSGPIPPNPAELLSSNRARLLFSGLTEAYDIVIVDSPPVISASDAIILSTLVAGTLVVIKYGQIAKDTAKDMLAQLKNVKANILGAVLNHVPAKKGGGAFYDFSRV